MTVGELIEKLQKIEDKSLPVHAYDWWSENFSEATVVSNKEMVIISNGGKGSE